MRSEKIDRSVFRFFFSFFFLRQCRQSGFSFPSIRKIEKKGRGKEETRGESNEFYQKSRLVELIACDDGRDEIKPESRLRSLEIGRVKSKRRDMAGTRQEGRNKTKNSERHFLHPNFRDEKSGIRGA